MKNRVVLVTGAGRGMGKGIAHAFAVEGAKVILSDINSEDLNGALKALEPYEENLLAVKTDVSKEEDVNKMVAEAIGRFGKVDVLINNAGIARSKFVTETGEKEWDQIFNVNVKGTFLCSKAVISDMIKRKEGKIINIASNAARIPRIKLAAYCASKAAVVQFSKVLALEGATYGITVNAICPGATNTQLLKNVPAQLNEMINGDLKMFRCGIPLGKLAEIEDIAALTLFLASEGARHITGEAIFIDGGQSMV